MRNGQVLELILVPKSRELGIVPMLVHPVASDSPSPDEWRFMIRLLKDHNSKWSAQRY